VDSAHAHRRPRKIRRTGRHTTPSQVEKVAEKAGKAAPAMAIAGAIVAGPQAHAAVENHHGQATTAAEQVHRVHLDAFVRQDESATSTYTVQPGDTLSSIAQRFYGNPADWEALYQQNENVIQNPNDIYVGEVLTVPSDPSANAASYAPKHAKSTTVLTTSATALSGTLDCSGLEALWEEAGGSSSAAFMAAEIAMAESGGNQYAVSPTSDYGYWQINLPSWGPTLATFDAVGNAKAAIQISDDGTNWNPWTTYQSGAYAGRC
jgi:LysM repeat protein